jgi:hypothetical protein
MSNSSAEKQKAIIILGMHRSGTSAVSRVVNLLGVDLGPNLLPPAPDNPSGFWEHKEIMEVDEQIFYALGRHWTYYLTRLPENWWLRDDIRPLEQKLVALVKRDFHESTLWGLKDPRLCRLLPLWHRVFEGSNCQPHFLHTIRNPLEVADSLNKRDGLPRNASFILWLLHVLEAERETRGYSRVFVTFDQLLEDWRSTMRRVATAFHWDCDEAIRTVGPQIDLFLNPRMKHHNRERKSENDDGAAMPQLVYSVYNAVVRASRGDLNGMTTALDSLSQEMDVGMNSFPAKLVVPELESQISRASELRSQLSTCQAELNRILESWSWWLTSPLRRLHDFWTRNKN